MAQLPAARAGAMTVIVVLLTNVTFGAVTTEGLGKPIPNVTVGVPTNPVPVIVTTVPPAVEQVVGLMDVIAGAALAERGLTSSAATADATMTTAMRKNRE